MRCYNGINVMKPGSYAKWVQVKSDEEIAARTQDIVIRDLEDDVDRIGKQLSSESYRASCHDNMLGNQQEMLDTYARRISYLEKRERNQNRFDILHFVLTGLIGYVVIKHDQILDEHRRRIDRLEEIMRTRREQGKES